MTRRETRLRARIDEVTDQRDQAIARLAAYRQRWRRRCVYCGERIRAQSLACGSHRDLLTVDPYYCTRPTEERAAAA